jgi:pyridoxine 4-dehydrogenase
VALAWLLRRSPVIVPIPGTKNAGHLDHNMRASEIAGELTEEEVTALTAVEDEASARLDTMSSQMSDALGRRRTAASSA